MMNRHITQWHNPRDCSAACTRVENVMMQLKALVKSIEDEEGRYGPTKLRGDEDKHLAFTPRLKQAGGPANNLRFPEPPPKDGMHPCRCCKRNGLQDYCGTLGQECYMNPKAVFNSGHPEMPHQQQQVQPRGYQSHNTPVVSNCHGMDVQQGRAREACVGENCLNDFYLIPVEK